MKISKRNRIKKRVPVDRCRSREAEGTAEGEADLVCRIGGLAAASLDAQSYTTDRYHTHSSQSGYFEIVGH